MPAAARCMCGPRTRAPARSRFFAADAATTARRDPTGTLPIVRRWSRDLDQRWATLKRMLPSAVEDKANPVNMISHSVLTGKGDPIAGFQSWLDEALRQIVVGVNGAWLMRYVREASDMGSAHARSAVGSSVEAVQPQADRTHILQSLAIVELQGIAEATSQRMVRAFADGLMLRKSRAVVVGELRRAIDEVGVRRGHLLASFMAVKAHAAAALDGLRALGVTRVGLVPEAQPPAPRSVVVDARGRPSKKGKVNVLTAEDDRVCPECEEIAADGPYYIDEAEHLIPAHVRCRCGFVPADPREREEVLGDAFDPDEPRAPDGKWKSEGGSVVAYHGTTDTAAKRAMKEGLTVGGHRRSFGGDMYKDDRGKAVFVANTFKTADWYARQRIWGPLGGKGKPVILELRVPKSEWKRFQGDTLHKGKGSAYMTKNIPAKWIVAAHGSKFYDSSDDEFLTLWMVVEPDDITAEDSATHIAAGVMITADDTGRTLFLRCSGTGDAGGTWAFPAGGVEPGETFEQAAARETREETGYEPDQAELGQVHRQNWNGVDFTTYMHSTPSEFRPHMSEEHDAYKWSHLEQAPEPLHPGVERTLDDMDAALRVRDAFDPDEPRDKNGKWTATGYHGTASEFGELEAREPVGQFTGNKDVRGIYFSGEERSAWGYAHLASKRPGAGKKRVIAAHIEMSNPLDITKEIKKGQKKGMTFGEAKRAAIAQRKPEHDGIVFRGDRVNPPEYIVFSRANVRIKDSAAFDPEKHPRDDHGRWSESGGGPAAHQAGLTPGSKKDKIKSDLQRSLSTKLPIALDKLADNLSHTEVSADEFMARAVPVPTVGRPVLKFDDNRNLSILSALADEDGAHIGSMQRSFDFDNKTANHKELVFKDAATGSGRAKDILRSQVDLYQKLGMEKVALHANVNVGGYAWAKYGFTPDEFEWKNALRKELNNRLDLHDMPAADKSAMKKLINSDEPKAIWAIADSKYGKHMLMDADWYGSLGLHDKAAMQRFNTYVGKKHA